ncbi:hypothetical protein G9A89_002467 [Geosiphon pyriformis]|nr:hypothetical protein G9A89_002467 [Geosiphon pyriformis]
MARIPQNKAQKRLENVVNKIITKIKLAMKEQQIVGLHQKLTRETWTWWIQQFPKNYYKTKQLFNTTILQQLKHFVGKNNLSTQARAIYQIHTAFQDQPEILFNKAINTTKSGHHAEKEIGKTLGKIHLLSTLLNFCPLYKGLHQTFRYNTCRTSSTEVTLEHQVMGLLFNSTAEIIICNIISLWEITESEEKKGKDQEFNYQNPILKDLNIQTQQHLENSEIETPNIRTLEPIQPPQVPPQQPLPLQQPLQQSSQPPNLDPMAYAPIAKLDNFTSEEDDTQSLINKPQDFDAFKMEFLRYFSNNNSINCLVNMFTTMKQGETEAVTTYLGCFHQNLHQIQAIDANYFTAPQILNQFICGLCSSILQHVCPLHPGTLQDAVTCTRNFESAELEANHAQAVNLVMNRSSELDSKLEKFSESINKKLEGYLVDNYAIY